MKRSRASKARRHLPRLLDRVARGESLTITRHGQPVARLVPTRDYPSQKPDLYATRSILTLSAFL